MTEVVFFHESLAHRLEADRVELPFILDVVLHVTLCGSGVGHKPEWHRVDLGMSPLASPISFRSLATGQSDARS